MQNFAEKMASLPSQGRVAKPIPCAYREQADPASPGNWQEGPPHVHPYCSTSHALAYRCSILNSSLLLHRASQYCKNSDTTGRENPWAHLEPLFSNFRYGFMNMQIHVCN